MLQFTTEDLELTNEARKSSKRRKSEQICKGAFKTTDALQVTPEVRNASYLSGCRYLMKTSDSSLILIMPKLRKNIPGYLSPNTKLVLFSDFEQYRNADRQQSRAC